MITHLIVGLGNPGKTYEHTWHNLGFMVVDALAAKLGPAPFKLEKKFQAEIAQHDDLLMVKPQTFMNNSGESVAAIAHYYKLKPKNIFVIHDEFDLPLGQIKISQGRGPGTHNGVKSVAEKLGSEDITRFRLGIGQEINTPLENYVLSPIPSDDASISSMISKTVVAIQTALTTDISSVMNHYNT